MKAAASRILICDGHEIVREGIRARIEEVPGFEVAGEAADGRQVIDLARKLGPDLLITEVELPRLNGISAAIRVLEVRPDQRILIYTAHDRATVCELVARAGAHGCVSKSAPASELTEACRTVLDGGTWFEEFPAGSAGDGNELERLLTLSDRELQILNLLATGMRAREIADEAGITQATVYTHVRNAVGKLGVGTRVQAVALAIRYSFLTPAENAAPKLRSPGGTPASSR